MKLNNKIAFFKVRLLVTLSLALFALSSCTKEQQIFGDVPSSNSLEIDIVLPQVEVSQIFRSGSSRDTDIGSPEQREIKRIAIFVFDEYGTTLEHLLAIDDMTELPPEQIKWGANTLIITNITKKDRPKKIYVIANWDKSRDELSTYTVKMLKEAFTQIETIDEINEIAQLPLLMSGSLDITKVPDTNPFSVEVPIKRQLSKIEIKVRLEPQTQYDFANIEWSHEQAMIQVFNIHKQSYIIGQDTGPNSDMMLDTDLMQIPHIKGTQTLPPSDGLVWSKEVYIHENLALRENKATRIVLRLPFKYRNADIYIEDNCYEVFIQNATLHDGDPYKLWRNTIFRLNLFIMGVGLPFEKLRSGVNVVAQ